MTKRGRVEKTYAFEVPDRIPFVPAIYEHKARLVGRLPSEVCRSLELLLESLDKELEVYDPDMLVVGIDVYNVEAEAYGARVEDPGGNETIERLNMGLTFRVYGPHALGIQYIASLRDAHYPDRADSHQTAGTFSLVYTWLGDTKFGAVEWRGADNR